LNEGTQPLYAALGQVGSSLEELLAALPALQTEVGTSVTGLISPTAAIGSARLQSGPLEEEAEEKPAEEKQEKTKRSLFPWKRQAVKQPGHSAQAEEGGTEVLEALFVPSLVLVCQQPRMEFLVDRQDFVFGSRSGDAEGKIEFSNAVSRRHCKVTQVDGQNYIVDLGSSNGTSVNGKKLEKDKPVALRDGDRVKLANVELTAKSI
jgi:hypothetical protein